MCGSDPRARRQDGRFEVTPSAPVSATLTASANSSPTCSGASMTNRPWAAGRRSSGPASKRRSSSDWICPGRGCAARRGCPRSAGALSAQARRRRTPPCAARPAGRSCRPSFRARPHGAADGLDDRSLSTVGVDERDRVDPRHVDAFGQQPDVGQQPVLLGRRRSGSARAASCGRVRHCVAVDVP